MPVPGYRVTESLYCLEVAGHGVIRHMPAHNTGQPAALLRNGQMHAPRELDFYLQQLRPHPFRARDPLNPEPSAPRHRADVRETQEIERLRLAGPACLPVPGSGPPRLAQPRLAQVESLTEIRAPA